MLVLTEEQAKKIFNTNPNIYPAYRAELEYIAKGRMAHYCYGRALMLRYMYSDDLPSPEIPEDHPDYVFARFEMTENHPSSPYMKCTGGAIRNFSGLLKKVRAYGLISDESTLGKIENVRSHNWNSMKGSKGQHWTQPEEITMMNEVLDDVISHLKKEYDVI